MSKHQGPPATSILSSIQGPTPALRPPHRATLPLWLALLLKRQRRASIAPPAWLHHTALQEILDRETSNSRQDVFTEATPLSSQHEGTDANGNTQSATPPFRPSSIAMAPADNLPYHYLELAQLLLTHCSDDVPDFELVQRLLRDLREVRMAKVRGLVPKLDSGAGVKLNGIGAMELGEHRQFLGGVVDGLRKLGASREAVVKERLEEDGGFDGGRGVEGDDMDL